MARWRRGRIDSYKGRTRRGFRDETRANYRRDLERAEEFFGASTRLATIGPRRVKAYTAELERQGLCANTIRVKMASLRAMFGDAMDEEVIRRNPAARLRYGSESEVDEHGDEQVKTKALTDAELRLLMGNVPERHRLFVEFLAATGLRLSEAIAVRWSDVRESAADKWSDVEGGHVHVRRRWYRGRYGPPKSRFGWRVVPLTTGMARRLWLLRRQSDFGGDDDLVFPTSVGTPRDHSKMHKIVKRAGMAAGVPWAGPHVLRHSCITGLFRRGVNPKAIQLWAGHHSPAFTMERYVHLLSADLPSADSLDGWDWQPAEEAAWADGKVGTVAGVEA